MYSKDLRARVIWLKFGLRFHYSRIAQVLNISYSTVYRVVKKFLRTGIVECERVGRPSRSSLHNHEQYILMEEIMKNPSLTLNELRFEIRRNTGSDYACSTIYRNLQRFGLSRKVVRGCMYFD